MSDTYEGNEDLQVVEFNINEPGLGEYRPDIDTENVPKSQRPAPPQDGHHWVRFRLFEKRKGPPVYIKGTKDPRTGRILDARVVVALSGRVVNDAGEDGAFVKEWYPSSAVMKGARGSQVTAIAYLAGKPIKAGSSVQQIAQHMETLFAEAGEEGILLLVKTRWIKSVPKVDENGLYVFKGTDGEGNGIKDYKETKGEKRIKDEAVKEAKELVAAWTMKDGETFESFAVRKQRFIDEAPERAHIFLEPVTGDERTVSAEVQELIDHTTMVE